MQEKNYIKPKAEHIAFYSEEEITAVAPPVQSFVNSDPEGGVVGGSQVIVPGNPDWED